MMWWWTSGERRSHRAVIEPSDAHPSLVHVDVLHLVPYTRVDAPLTEGLRAAGDELLHVLHDLADVVGHPAGGVAGVAASLEGNDLQIGAPSPCFRSRAHTRGIAADHNQPLSHPWINLLGWAPPMQWSQRAGALTWLQA
jgi:hypothetical protein